MLNFYLKDLYRCIHHSDRGSQYGSKNYIKLLTQYEIKISMGLCAMDNSYVERVNGIIKNEYLGFRELHTLKELKRELTRAVKHYNTKRIHKSFRNE